MRSKLTIPALVLATVAAAGCNHAAAPLVTNPPPAVAPPAPPTSVATIAPRSHVRDSMEAAIAAHLNNRPFPPGTALRSIIVRGHVATLDFNRAFASLANSGEATESEAQKLLRRTLARFPEIEQMRVTVEDAPFDSQATDWNTPFRVRDERSRDSDVQAPKPIDGGAAH